MTKDVKELIASVEKQGWLLIRDRKHYIARSPDGVTQVAFAKTPSDHRAIRNVKATFKRHGVQL